MGSCHSCVENPWLLCYTRSSSYATCLQWCREISPSIHTTSPFHSYYITHVKGFLYWMILSSGCNRQVIANHDQTVSVIILPTEANLHVLDLIHLLTETLGNCNMLPQTSTPEYMLNTKTSTHLQYPSRQRSKQSWNSFRNTSHWIDHQWAWQGLKMVLNLHIIHAWAALRLVAWPGGRQMWCSKLA